VPQQSFSVTGLHCQSCVRIVTQTLSELPGVNRVDIDLVSNGASTVRVDAADALSAEQVQAALAEEGDYSVA
jgi:copper chaperone CopZ